MGSRLLYLDWSKRDFAAWLGKHDFSEELRRGCLSGDLEAKAISYHPHQLNEAECRETRMFYGEFLDSADMGLYEAFEAAMVSVFLDILGQTRKFYLVKHNKLSLIKKEKTLRQHIVKALRHEDFVVFVLPDKKSVIVSGYDLTWELYSWVSLSQNTVVNDFKGHPLINVW